MTSWVKKLRKSGFSIDEAGFLDLKYSMLGDWKIINEGSYGIILSSGDKILKIQKNISENNKFNNNIVGEFLKEVKMQQMVYTCTKGYRSLTPKIFSYGKNWVLMKNVPGKSIWDGIYRTERAFSRKPSGRTSRRCRRFTRNVGSVILMRTGTTRCMMRRLVL